jgi:serine/threonine protein kinase
VIYQAIWKADNSKVAVKRLKIEKKIMEILKKELSIMEMLEHKNVVYYRNSFIYENYLWVCIYFDDKNENNNILFLTLRLLWSIVI